MLYEIVLRNSLEYAFAINIIIHRGIERNAEKRAFVHRSNSHHNGGFSNSWILRFPFQVAFAPAENANPGLIYRPPTVVWCQGNFGHGWLKAKRLAWSTLWKMLFSEASRNLTPMFSIRRDASLSIPCNRVSFGWRLRGRERV